MAESNYVLKFPLPVGSVCRIPYEHKILHVGMQKGTVTLWAEVPEGLPKATGNRAYEVMPTGVAFPAWYEYVGTALEDDGLYVWHVYKTSAEQGAS